MAPAFACGKAAPAAGLSFRHGCHTALSAATAVAIGSTAEAEQLLATVAARRATRATCLNATSSRSHSLVLLRAGAEALRLAFVDLAGSERLPEAEAVAAEESRHINRSLSALGAVIHALRHRANHLPYRACLLTRLLEPFFKAIGSSES